jgi:hypothetical protein
MLDGVMTHVAQEKPDSVNGLDCWFSSGYCAAVSWGGHVRLFSIERRKYVADFFTHKDSGGVSVAMSEDDRHCFAGSYYAWGLACFHVETGETLWRRKDLKRFYGLSFSGNQRALYAYFDGEAGLLLDPKTGVTLERIRDCKEVYCSSSDGHILIRGGKHLRLVTQSGEIAWSVATTGFAVHAVAWSGECLAVSEAQGLVRCFRIADGTLLWSHRRYCRDLSYSSAQRRFIGIDDWKAPLLVEWDEQAGTESSTLAIPREVRHAQFCNKGELLCSVDVSSFDMSFLNWHEPLS